MRLIPILFAAGATVFVAAPVACSKAKAEKTMPAAAPAAKGAMDGTVLEVLPSPPYAYLRLRTAQGEVWAAVPAAEVKVGASVSVLVQMKMDKFESPSLHRTFPSLFMGTLAGAATPAAGPARTLSTLAPAAPDEKVEKAQGANARVIAELYAQRNDLKDKTVTVKGKIVKYNEGIMGKTWLHLRDGSGSAQTRDNDLTVTTKDVAKMGDIVTVKGVVHVNKDIGMGYAYPVLIEDAKLAH